MLLSEYFHLVKSQPELDFVDVPVDSDILLFIDPFAISLRTDPWSQNCHEDIVNYFQNLIEIIRSGDNEEARRQLTHLGECNETRLGFSRGNPDGAGIGPGQSEKIFQALTESSAVRTGFVSSLEECELLVNGIARDKISDMTTNIIKKQLTEYTFQQCNLWDLPTSRVPLKPFYNRYTRDWESGYFDLPVANEKPVLLVPKIIVRMDPNYDQQDYYNNFVLNYLQAEHLSANSSLVRVLKRTGERRVTKKDLKARYPCTKHFLYSFSKEHPEVLRDYRAALARMEREGIEGWVNTGDETILAKSLGAVLQNTHVGNDDAYSYHRLIIGIIEFLFFPNLISPRKEQEIHEGRKRIDIVVENGATDGIFFRIHNSFEIPCAYVPIECKNYGKEIGNPELDQLAGRFSASGKRQFGMICCRNFEDRTLFVKRCRDTFNDSRGLIIPLDDDTIIQCLSLIANEKRRDVDKLMANIVHEVCLN
jgi:hypothetical protein